MKNKTLITLDIVEEDGTATTVNYREKDPIVIPRIGDTINFTNEDAVILAGRVYNVIFCYLKDKGLKKIGIFTKRI